MGELKNPSADSNSGHYNLRDVFVSSNVRCEPSREIGDIETSLEDISGSGAIEGGEGSAEGKGGAVESGVEYGVVGIISEASIEEVWGTIGEILAIEGLVILAEDQLPERVAVVDQCVYEMSVDWAICVHCGIVGNCSHSGAATEANSA